MQRLSFVLVIKPAGLVPDGDGTFLPGPHPEQQEEAQANDYASDVEALARDLPH